MKPAEQKAREIFARYLEAGFPYRARVVRRGSELPLKERAAIDAIIEALGTP